MSKIEIKKWDGNILFSGEFNTLKKATEAAVRGGAYLGYAYLRGADLRGADLRGAYLGDAYLRGAYLRGADLRGADLRDAYLRGADLRGADLGGTDLVGADLRGADLRGTDLGGAYLRGAYLRGADGINKYMTTPLYMLLDQVGKIRAYKLVNEKGEGPCYGGIKYEIGESYEVKDAETHEDIECARGISLASMDWCLKEWRDGYKILIAEFTKKDIAAIPIGSDGKFRVFRCKIVGEKNP